MHITFQANAARLQDVNEIGLMHFCNNSSKVKVRELFSLGRSVYHYIFNRVYNNHTTRYIWTASSEFGTYRMCEQRRFRRACASAQSRQNLRCSLIQALSQEEPSVRKPDPLPLWMAGHAQLKFVMTECLKTQIRLTGLILCIGQQSSRGHVYNCFVYKQCIQNIWVVYF